MPWPTYDPSVPSVAAFRSNVANLLRSEAGTSHPRTVIVFAVDGIPFQLAKDQWPTTPATRYRSVFPTTTSTAWLSALTGLEVHEHGVPGYRFLGPSGSLIDVFQYQGELGCPDTGNVFSDAIELGYRSVAILGDLEPFPCSWRDILLRSAIPAFGTRFYTGNQNPTIDQIVGALREAIETSLDQTSAPTFVWCFIDIDQYIHRNGYDGHVRGVLGGIGRYAEELARRGLVVVAHSDHGLVETEHDPHLERLLESVTDLCALPIGGAGRTRWLYPIAGGETRLTDYLAARLPPTIRLLSADTIFPKSSLARSRIGDVVIVAEGRKFITQPGYQFEHGSCSEIESEVFGAIWNPR